jgi:hypothetical protein
MLLGGRRWIAGRLDAALATLATTAARAAEDVGAPLCGDVPTPTAADEQDSGRRVHRSPVHR